MSTQQELEQKKQLAREYWLYSPCTQKEICEKIDIAIQTLVNWRKEGNWDILREGIAKASDKRFEHYLKLLDLFTLKLSQPHNSIDIDELAKLQTLIERIGTKNIEPADVEKVGLAIIRYLDEVMPDKKDFYINFYRSFAEWYNRKKTL